MPSQLNMPKSITIGTAWSASDIPAFVSQISPERGSYVELKNLQIQLIIYRETGNL